MKRIWARSFTAAIFLFGIHLHATAYYVDSRAGNDANAGTSKAAPWRSLRKVNSGSFKPGDRILFRAGSVWQGQLAPPSSGAEGKPILIDKYGAGPLPRIDGNGVKGGAVSLHNVEQIEVRHLEVTNNADAPAFRDGVLITLDNFGTAHHIVVADLYIHDVRGAEDPKLSGGIGYDSKGDKTPSRYDDLCIEHNVIWHVDRSGIVGSGHSGRKNWFPSLHVLIRDNYLDDIGGDGIVPWVATRPIVEHNIVLWSHKRSPDYNAGIWSWSTDDAIFQLNETAYTQGTKDGEGFDSDHYNRNSLFQYNLSHDNRGGFMLLCTPVLRRDPENDIGNTGTVVRDNISWNDHTRTFNLAGASDLRVEKNLIYVGPGDDVQVLLVSNWLGWSHDALFTANKIYVEGRASYGHQIERNMQNGTYRIAPGWTMAKNVRFLGNSYFGSEATAPPEDTESYVDRSKQAAPWKEDEPKFDATNGANIARFDEFMKQHRRWMMAVMRERLGVKIRLEKFALGK